MSPKGLYLHVPQREAIHYQGDPWTWEGRNSSLSFFLDFWEGSLSQHLCQESDGTEISGEEKRYKMLWVLDPELFLSLYPFLNDACLSLSLFISSPAGLLLPAIFFFFPSFFSLPADSEFWLPPALLSDMISQNHFRVPRDTGGSFYFYFSCSLYWAHCFALLIFSPARLQIFPRPAGIFTRKSPSQRCRPSWGDGAEGTDTFRAAGTAVKSSGSWIQPVSQQKSMFLGFLSVLSSCVCVLAIWSVYLPPPLVSLDDNSFRSEGGRYKCLWLRVKTSHSDLNMITRKWVALAILKLSSSPSLIYRAPPMGMAHARCTH